MAQSNGRRDVRRPKAKERKFELSRKEKTIEHIQAQVVAVQKGEGDTSFKIKELLKLKMPLEVAKILHIPAKQVYEVIEAMPEDKAKEVKTAFANNRLNITSNIKALKGIGKSSGQAIKLIEKKVNGGLVIELAQVYFAMGEYDRAIKVMNLVLHDDRVPQSIKSKVSEEKSNIDMEIKAIKIREAYKKFKDKPSYDYLCKEYNVRTGFLLNILGMEPRNK